MAQDASRTSPGRLRRPQEAPRRPQEGPKIAQNWVTRLEASGFFGFRLQEPRKTDFGPILGPSWALLGPILGPSWACLGLPELSWAHLGPILAPSWASSGLSGPILGPCSPYVDCLRPSWGHLASNLGKQWGSLRPSCDQGGCIPLVIDAFAHLPSTRAGGMREAIE